MEMTTALLLEYLSGFPRQMLPAVLAFFLPMARRKRWYRFVWVPFVLIGACIGLGFVVWPAWYRVLGASESYFAIHYLLVLCSYALSIRLMCDASWAETLYAVVCAYLVEHLHYCVTMLGEHLLGACPWWNSPFVDYGLMILLYGLVWWLFARPLCQGGHYSATATRSVWLLAVEFAFMYALSIYVDSLGLAWLHGLYGIVCIAFILLSERHWVLQARLETELKQKEQLWALNKAQYEMTQENIDLINRKCHDLRHQMDALRTVAGEEERQQAVAAMRQAIRIYDTHFKTGNESLDTVLMQKGLICSQEGIELAVMADGRLLSFLPPVELYTLLANILDNAIEANRRLGEGAKRYIRLTVHEKKGLILLQAENPYTGEIRMKDGLPVTTKADRDYHGIGTRSIAATAEQYGGVLRIQAEDGLFVLRLIFQQPESA